MRQRDRNKRRRIERQDEAKARQASYDALSLEQKLARAVERGGTTALLGGVRLA